MADLPPRRPPSELDQLHKLGDSKFNGSGGSARGTGSSVAARGTYSLSEASTASSSQVRKTTPTPTVPTTTASSSGVPISRSAAQSHRANDAYMQEFDTAYAELHGAATKGGGGGLTSRSNTGGRTTTTSGGGTVLIAGRGRGNSVGSNGSAGSREGVDPYLAYNKSAGLATGTKTTSSMSTNNKTGGTTGGRIISSSTSISVLNTRDDEDEGNDDGGVVVSSKNRASNNSGTARSSDQYSSSSSPSAARATATATNNITGRPSGAGAGSSASSSGPNPHPLALPPYSMNDFTSISPQWYRGPLVPEGRFLDLSDRPHVCMAINRFSSSSSSSSSARQTSSIAKSSLTSNNRLSSSYEAAIGSTDHAIYTIDTRSGTRTKTLYGGKYGHSEWVTGVCYLGDGSGRVLSTAMDGKTCLWATRPAGKYYPCTDLIGHFGSVTTVVSPGGGNAACGTPSSVWGGHCVTIGYDKTIRLWDVARSGGACMFTAKSHAAPILQVALHATDVEAPDEFWAVTGDRDGIANIWKLHDGGSCEGALRGHKGHLTACAWLPADAGAIGSSNNNNSNKKKAGDDDDENDDTAADGSGGGVSAGGTTGNSNLVITGAQDGHVRVWDVRSRACVANIGAHASDTGSGAVGEISVTRIGNSDQASSSSTTTQQQQQLGSETVIVTAGADKRICVLDPRAGFQVRNEFTDHKDFIYSLTVAGPLCFSGSGDGLVYVHDLVQGKVLWAVGAGMAAIRALGVVGGKHLIATGDDGKALIYDF